MRSYPGFRLGAQMFFCSAALSFFPPFCRDPGLFWLLSGLCLVCALIAARLTHPLLRLPLGLVPGLALLLPVSGWVSFGAAACMVLYGAVLMCTDSFCPESWVYRREAVWTLALCGFLSIVSFFWTNGGVQTLWMLLCAAALVLLALQMLHVSGSMGPRWQLRILGVLLGILLVGVLLGLGLWGILPLLRQLGRWIATAFMGLVALWAQLYTLFYSTILRLLQVDTWPYDNTLPTLYYENPDAPEKPAVSSESPHADPIRFDIPWGELLAFLVFVLLAVLAIRFLRAGGLRRLRRRVVTRATGAERPEAAARSRKRTERTEDNREKLRYIYSQYLSFLKSKNIELKASDTTEDISEASSELFLQTDELLRGLYRKARYSSGEISDGELLAAGEALNRLISEENLRGREETSVSP